MAEELQRFILRRVLLGWREESGRNGGGLVHAIAVWGLRLLSPPPPPSYLLSKKSFARDSIQGVTQSHSIFNSNKQYIPPIQGVNRGEYRGASLRGGFLSLHRQGRRGLCHSALDRCVAAAPLCERASWRLHRSVSCNTL